MPFNSDFNIGNLVGGQSNNSLISQFQQRTIDTALKAIDKRTDSYVNNALETGQHPTQVLSTLINNMNPQPQQPQQMQQQFDPGFAGKLMMTGAALQGQDPSAVLKNLMAMQQVPIELQMKQQQQQVELQGMPIELSYKQALTKQAEAKAKQEGAMADLYNKGILHVDQATGEQTTSDNPNAVTLLPLPNGQIIQLDKMADYKSTMDTLERYNQQLISQYNATNSILHPRVKDSILKEINDNKEQIKNLQETMKSKLKNVGKEQLPANITEEDVQHTLKLHPEYTREGLLKKLNRSK